MPPAPIRRFYDQVAVVPSGDGYAVHLDGKPIKTPGRRTLNVPTEALAAAIAEEWHAVGKEADFLPLTALANAAVDRVGPNRPAVEETLTGFVRTDLICYLADRPAGLAERQIEAWTPLRRWAEESLGAPLATTVGLRAVSQPDAALEALAREVSAHDDFRLAALLKAVQASGSLVIGLALSSGRITSEGAWHASRIDEAWQREQWGEDAEDEARSRRLKSELEVAARLMRLLD